MNKLGIHFDLRDDGTADIQLNFNNLGQCLWVFIRLLGEVENRHGSDCAQQLVINLPHLGQGYAKKKQNEDLLHDLLESGIPPSRFAEERAAENWEFVRLAKENEKLANDARRRGENPVDYEMAAAAARLKRKRRGPGGNTTAASIATQLRRLLAMEEANARTASGRMAQITRFVGAVQRAGHRRTKSKKMSGQ